MWRFAALFWLFLVSSVAQASVVYTFTGVVPGGAFLPPVSGPVAIGETWVATLIIDEAAADLSASDWEGVYDDAIVGADLAFSGGWSVAMPAGATGDVFIWDDIELFPGAVFDYIEVEFPLDGGSVRITTGDGVFTGGPVALFDSDALPVTATSLVGQVTLDYFQSIVTGFLAYWVRYDVAPGTFTVSGGSVAGIVPSPPSLVLLAIGLVGFSVLRGLGPRR